MADALSSVSVQFILAVIELVLYGFSILLFFVVVTQSLLGGKTWSQVNKQMIIFSVSLFFFQTMYAAVGIRRRYEGFVLLGDSDPGGLTAFFENVTTTEVLLRNIAWNCQVALGDAIMIWRAYMVWKSICIVSLPILVWAGFVVSAIGELIAMHQTNPSLNGLFVDSVGPWSLAALASTMVCNLLSTGLLVLRLQRMEKDHTSFNVNRHSRARPALWIILDTGLIYTTWVLIAFITDVLGSRVEYLFDNSLPSIVSIVFFTILLRISYHQKSNRMLRSSDSQYVADGSRTLSAFHARTQDYEMQPDSIRVHITQMTDSTGTEPSDIKGERLSR